MEEGVAACYDRLDSILSVRPNGIAPPPFGGEL